MTLQEWFEQEPRPMSKYRLAKRLGITPSYISRLCKPEPPFPHPDIIRRIEETTKGAVTTADWLARRRGRAKRVEIEEKEVEAEVVKVPPEHVDRALFDTIRRIVASEVRRQIALEKGRKVTGPATNGHRRYVTIDEFVKIMGRKSRNWYYNHVKDDGFPQRHYLPGNDKPVLDLDECIAWQKQATTAPPWKAKRKA